MMTESTMIRCAECKMPMPDTDPCPICGRKMCDSCFDPICGVCLGCPGEVPEFSAEQTNDIMNAVDRRFRDFRIEQAIKRKDHFDAIKTLLHVHRADVFADVAKLVGKDTLLKTGS